MAQDIDATSEDKMTFPTNQIMKRHLTSPHSFLSSSPILQESSSSADFNIFGSFQEDLSTPTRLEHQHPSIQNDTFEENECRNLCSSQLASSVLNERSVNTEDQMLEQLINALGDGDRQSFEKDQEEMRATSGKSANHSLDNSQVNYQNVCPADQFELLFQDELNSPLIKFCPGTPDTLTDPELSKNELSDAENMDVSSSESDSITAKSRKRKVYSKRKHNSRQPQVEAASGVDLTKHGQSKINERSDVYERPTAQQIELALGVTSGQAEGQLVSTESGSQFMVVGGQVLEILGSGGNIVQTNIEEQQNEKNKWSSVDREELGRMKAGNEVHQVQTKSEINLDNDLEPIEDVNGEDKRNECPKNFIRSVHDTRDLRPTEGLMSRKERDEQIKKLRASQEEAHLGKSINTQNNIELSSNGCAEKIKPKSNGCETPPENQNKCWIGMKGNYIPKTPSPIKEVIHSAPYGIGRTKIDGQDKLIVLKSRLPTIDGGRFDCDLRPTEGLIARKKDRGTINDYEQNAINKTKHCPKSTPAVKSDEGMENNLIKKWDSPSSMYIDTQNDLNNISNDSSNSTGMANFEQTEAHRISFKTPRAQMDERKLTNPNIQNYCSSKAIDRLNETFTSKSDSHSDEILLEQSKDDAISGYVASNGHGNRLSNATYTNCDPQAGSSHGMQPYSNKNDPLKTEIQQSDEMIHHINMNDKGNIECYRNEFSNISKHPSSQNYQPFMGHTTVNHKAALNCPSVPQQIPTYNGCVSKQIFNHYGQGASNRSMYAYPQPSSFPQSYAQYYPQMYYQYLRYQSQLRYQMQLKQWYNSYYQRGAQWYNSFCQEGGQSYPNYYSNHQYYKYHYPHGLMPNCHNGSTSFQGSYQNPMYEASNSFMNQQAPLGNPMNKVRSNNPVKAHSQVLRDEYENFRGDDSSQNLIPFTSQVDKENSGGKEGHINYLEKEDNAEDLMAHQEMGDLQVYQERSTPYNNHEPDEDVSSGIPNVQDQTNEIANIKFIKDDDNKLLQEISTQSIVMDIDSRKRASSNLQEDFPEFTYGHSSDSSIGENSSKKPCFKLAVEEVKTETPEDQVMNAFPEENFIGLPISFNETDASVINDVGPLNKNDTRVVNDDDPFIKADFSVVNEVNIFSTKDVNVVKVGSSSTVAIFAEAPLLPRSDVGCITESTTNNKYEKEAECFNLNGDTMINSPPGNLNNCASRRRPRSTYSKKMLGSLMQEYVRSPYLTAGARSRLADKLAISEDRILIWFKNQRAKDRSLKKKLLTGGSDEEMMVAQNRDIVNEVLCKEGIDNFGVEQLAKLDSNNANIMIHLQSDHGNQVFSVNRNPVEDLGNHSDQLCSLKNSAENEESKDNYDDNSVEIGSSGINAHAVNKNQTNEESKLDSNMNLMFLVSDSSRFENKDKIDQKYDNIPNDTDKMNSKKIDDLGMNENYFDYNGDQVVHMIGDYGAKTNINENADTDLSHEQFEKLFNSIDGEGPNGDQCIGDYEFDFNFVV